MKYSLVNIYNFAKGKIKVSRVVTAQKMKFFIKGFFSNCDQIGSFLRIWLHLLKRSLRENFIFCAVCTTNKGEKLPLLAFIQRVPVITLG